MSPEAAQRLGRWGAYASSQGRGMTDDEHAAWSQGKEPPTIIEQVGQLDSMPICTLDAVRLRTIAVQSIQRDYPDQVQYQATVPSDDPSRAHGFIRLRDGRLYVVRVEFWHTEEKA